MILPEHMDLWSRNQRLYETLKGMGLYVDPVPERDEPNKINRLVVSAGLPFGQQATENAAEAGVLAAMEGAKVSEVVATADGGGDNVIHLPPMR